MPSASAIALHQPACTFCTRKGHTPVVRQKRHANARIRIPGVISLRCLRVVSVKQSIPGGARGRSILSPWERQDSQDSASLAKLALLAGPRPRSNGPGDGPRMVTGIVAGGPSGTTGYAMIQTTPDSGACARLGDFETRVNGLGSLLSATRG